MGPNTGLDTKQVLNKNVFDEWLGRWIHEWIDEWMDEGLSELFIYKKLDILKNLYIMLPHYTYFSGPLR